MPGKLLAQDLAQPPLVRRVDVRVQQADGDRLGPGLAQPGGERARLVLVERLQHLARRRSRARRSRSAAGAATSDGGFVQK